ncbi:hypothetical protein EDD16DRAFT_268876 [Pisolithus croceorrhizus]|nr:hypothetical protein EDD16DRAFT_268876 [Pisolithus croceorrhizus]KAI6113375.1 hypothetical protein EV401DRAFT_190523 [Pisolithus croceorrhizus]KAI6154344.1 hypothetical protein EDD17DRAFT_1632444 [Pisolithus thermaeus]
MIQRGRRVEFLVLGNLLLSWQVVSLTQATPSVEITVSTIHVHAEILQVRYGYYVYGAATRGRSMNKVCPQRGEMTCIADRDACPPQQKRYEIPEHTKGQQYQHRTSTGTPEPIVQSVDRRAANLCD